MLLRQIAVVLLLSSALLGQRSASPTSSAKVAAAPPQSAAPQPAVPSDDLAQMRADLNKMESLNMNMSSEIEFLHDQNLQILLRTNSQMWTILIRDLRRQLEREEQRRGTGPQPSGKENPGVKPNPR